MATFPPPPHDASEMLCFSGPHKILRAVIARVNVPLLWLMELLYHHGHLVQVSHLTKDFIISRIFQHVDISTSSQGNQSSKA